MAFGKNAMIIATVVFSVILFIMSLILIGMSVHVCSMDQFCLNMNKNEQKIRPDLYTGGRYWLGANHKFIKFPRI